MGFSTGFLYLCLFGTYALAFWYGAVLIMEPGSGYTIGVVLTVFFSVIIGAFGIAQVRFLEPDSNSDLKRLGSALRKTVILHDSYISSKLESKRL